MESPSSSPRVRSRLWTRGEPPVGLYVHVPFCRSICTYCAFAKGEYDPAGADRWLDGLEREIRLRAAVTWEGAPVLDTVFLGGGTPSALSVRQWDRLDSVLRAGFVLHPDLEFTSEANPESFTEETAAAMVRAGVNRVSLGVQSVHPRELFLLGRPHDAATARRAVDIARNAGFRNLNLDLMYGLPGQGVEDLAATLDAVLALGPEHLSAYCLGLEPGTPLAASVAERGGQPDEDTAREQYELVRERTAAAGLTAYEISSFSRENRECRHNLRYWTRSDVIGVGPSAHALLAGHRWANPAPLLRWLRAHEPGGQPPEPRPVPPRQARFEWVFLHLRLDRGFSLDAFEAAWGKPVTEVYGPVVDRMIGSGFLELRDGSLRLAPRARFVSDAVFAEFAPDER